MKYFNQVKIKYATLYTLLVLINLPAAETNAQNIVISNQNLTECCNNPVLIYGTDFLSLFKTHYKQANWNELIYYTSTSSINKFGKDLILQQYKGMHFGYESNLISMKFDDGVYLLNYEIYYQATKYIIRCQVIIENDTCRLQLPDNFLLQKIFLFE